MQILSHRPDEPEREHERHDRQVGDAMDVDEHDGCDFSCRGSNNILIFDIDAASESQASQLLRNALESQSEDGTSMRNANTIPVDELDISKDLSSSDSINSHPAPQYHYHGLATTQTQSQLYDDDESNPNDEGFHKENVNSSREALSPSCGNQVQSAVHVQTPIHPPKSLVDKPNRLPAKVSFKGILWRLMA
jgi:hypothetical protein